jgi:DNA-directed RNA polymerase subunit alpha
VSAPVGRDNFDELVEQLYESYTNFDQAHACVQDLEEEREGAEGEQAADLSEKIGILHFAMGEYDRAAGTLEQVKDRTEAAHFLGRTYLKMGREEDAVEMLEQGRAGDQDPETDAMQIDAVCRMRDDERAQEMLEELRDEDAPEHLLHYAAGRVAETAGRYGEALEHFEASLEQEPDYAPSLFRLAVNCDLNGDDERAVELYERCASMKPTYVGALINLGILYEDHGDYDKAISCYKRVLAIDPRHKQAQLYLKDAESSLTMYIDVTRSTRLRRAEELFALPGETAGETQQLPGAGASALGAPTPEAASEAAASQTDPEVREKLNTSVETLDLSTRSRKCMDRLGIKTVGELIQHTEEELLAVPNFGSTSIQEVNEKLEEMDLSLKGEE